MGLRDAITSNVKSLGAVRDDAQEMVGGLLNSAGQLVQAGVSEFITNKDEGKGIKDYDKFQQYSAQLNDPTLGDQERSNIFGLMKQDNVIDPVKFSQWQESEKPKDTIAKDDMDLVRKELETNIMDQLRKADTRYKKDAIIGHIEEIMKDYQDLADSYYKTKKDNPNISDAFRQDSRNRWLSIVKNKSKEFTDNILRGATDDEAYDRMMANDTGDANELVKTDQERRIYLHDQQIRNDFGTSRQDLKSGNIAGGIFNGVKGILNTAEALLTQGGDLLEEGKQKLGYYDTLEEWSNLNLEKGALNTIKSRGFEIFDGVNRIGPAVAGILAGNKAMGAMKIEQLLTRGLQAGKYVVQSAEAFAKYSDDMGALIKSAETALEGAKAGGIASDIITAEKYLNGLRNTASKVTGPLDMIKPSKAATFIAQNIGDAVFFDISAQSATGRPLTDEDVALNRMMNIPVNAGASLIVKGGLKDLGLPKININDGLYSKEVIETIANNAGLTKDDIAKMIVADKYNTTAADKIAYNSISYRGVQSKIDEAINTANKYVDDMKSGNENLDTKILKYEITNIVDNGVESYVKQGDGYAAFIDRTNLLNKKISEIITDNNYRPQLQSIILKNLNFSDDELKTVINAADVSQPVKDIVTMQMLKETKGAIADTSTATKFIEELKKNPQGISRELQTVYNDLTEQLVLKNPQKLKVGDMVGPYIYAGENTYRTISGHTISADDVMYEIRTGRGTYKNISGVVRKGVDALSNVEARLDFAIKNPNMFPSKDGIQEMIISDIFGKIKVLPSGEVQHVFHYGSDYKSPNMDTITINKFGSSLFSPFGIKFNLNSGTKGLVITGQPEQVADLLSTIRTLKSKGFSYSKLTDKEMAAFKATHIGEFAEAYGNKMEGSTWFDSLFKKVDGGYAMDFKVINPEGAGKQMGLYSKDFGQTEEVAAQYSITDMLASALTITGKENKQAFLAQVKRIVGKDNIAVDNIANYYGDFVETYVKTESHLERLNISSVLGQMFGEIVSDKVLLKMLNSIPLEESKTLMSSIIARILNKNQGGIVLLKEFKKIMESNKFNASFIRPFLASVDSLGKDYRGEVGQSINNIINSKRLIEVGKLMKRISKEDGELFKKSLSTIKKDLDNVMLNTATETEVADIVKYQVYDSLKRRGFLSEQFATKLVNKYTRAIMNMKENLLKRGDDAQIKMLIGAGVDDGFFHRVLSDGQHKITIPTLVDGDLYMFIKDPDNFFEVAYKHEKSHYLLSKMGEKEYFTSIINSIKKLRQLPEELHDVVYGYKELKVNMDDIIDTAYQRYLFAAGDPVELNRIYKSTTIAIEEKLIDQIALGSRYMSQDEINEFAKQINNLYNISYAIRNIPGGKINMSKSEFQSYVNGHFNRQYMATDMYIPSILSKSDIVTPKLQTKIIYDDVFKKTINEDYTDYIPKEKNFVPLSDLLNGKLKKEGIQYIIPDSTVKMLGEDIAKSTEELKNYDVYQIKMNPVYQEAGNFKVALQDNGVVYDFSPGNIKKQKIEFSNYESNIDEQIDSTISKETANTNLIYINNIGENFRNEYKLNGEKTIPASEALDGLWKVSHSADAFITKIGALLKVSGTKDSLNGIKVPLKNILVGEDVIRNIPEGMNKESFILNRNVANILSTYGLYSQGTVDLLNKSSLGVLKDKEYVNILRGKVDDYIDNVVKFINDIGLRDKKATDLASRDDFAMALNTYFKTMDEVPLIENIIKNFGLEEKAPKLTQEMKEAGMSMVNIRDELFSINPGAVFNKHLDDMSIKYNPSQYLITETKPSWFVEYNTAIVARRAYLADKLNNGKRALKIVGRNKSIRNYIENPTPLKKVFTAETMGLDFIKEAAPDIYKQTTFIVGGEAKLADTTNIYKMLFKAVTTDKKIVMHIGDEVKTYEGANFRRNPLFFKYDDLGTANEEVILKNIFSTISPFQLKKIGGFEGKLYNYIKKTQFAGERSSKLDQLRDSKVKDADGNEYKILGYRPTLIGEKQITDSEDILKSEYEYSEVVSPVYFMKDGMGMDDAREVLNRIDGAEVNFNKVSSLDDIKVTDRFIDILIQDSKGELKEASYDTVNGSIDDITKYTEPHNFPEMKEVVIDKIAYKDAEQLQKNALDSLGC